MSRNVKYEGYSKGVTASRIANFALMELLEALSMAKMREDYWAVDEMRKKLGELEVFLIAHVNDFSGDSDKP